MTTHDYDTVLYPSAVYSQTHPDRLATLAILHGLKPRDVRNCRVLELGCGDGFNLIAMAVASPDSIFVGIDYALAPIQKGRDAVNALGLDNVTLHHLDFSAAGGTLGIFDYVIAHGILSWLPDAVREQMLALCKRSLAPDGVAYISYNAMPGGHLRQAVRNMMLQHTAHLTDPHEKITQARALIKFLAASTTDDRAYKAMLEQERDRVHGYVDAGFYHDDLSTHNNAFYFSEFVSEAARHKLQFLSESDLTPEALGQFPPAAAGTLDQIPAADFIRRRQYLDFVKGRSFHQSLLCHQGLAVERHDLTKHIGALWFSGAVRSDAGAATLSSNEVVKFINPAGTEASCAHPWIKWALHHLGTRWPQRIAYAEIESLVRSWQHSGQTVIGAEAETELAASLQKSLLSAWASGLIEAHSTQVFYATEISGKPVASPLARWQLQFDAPILATLGHTALKLNGDMARELVRRMDGSKSRDQLAEELFALGQKNGNETHTDSALFREALDKNLKQLAGMGLLMPEERVKVES